MPTLHWLNDEEARKTSSQITENLQPRMGESTYLDAWQRSKSLPIERIVDEVSMLLETLN